MNWIVLLVLLARLGLSDAGAAMVLTDGLPSTYGGAFKFVNGRFVAVLNSIYQLNELFVVKNGEMRFTIELDGQQSTDTYEMNIGMIGGQTKTLCLLKLSLLSTVGWSDYKVSITSIVESGEVQFLNFIVREDGVFKSMNGAVPQSLLEPDTPGTMEIGMPDKPTAPGMYGFIMSFADNPKMVIKVHFEPGYVATMNYGHTL